jgi:chemosensory pili system protein ChpC
MLIPLNRHYLLLPNSSIAEVIPRAGITIATEGDQSWLGSVDWHGQQLPVVNLENLLNQAAEGETAANKLCIVHGINSQANISAFAIPCTGSPQLITLNHAALHLTHDDNHSPYLHCQIKISNKIALIPNLDQLEMTINMHRQ